MTCSYSATCRNNLGLLSRALLLYAGTERFTPPWYDAHTDFRGWTMSGKGPPGTPTYQGLGRLWSGGFVGRESVMYCPATEGRRFRKACRSYAALFARDGGDPFWQRPSLYRKSVPLSNGNGVGDLGGAWGVEDGGAVIVSSYWLRVFDTTWGNQSVHDLYNPETGMGIAVVSDTIVGYTPLPGVPGRPGDPVLISNHDRLWHVGFSDGVVRTYYEMDDRLKQELQLLSESTRASDRDAFGRNRIIFEGYFESLVGD